MRQPNIYLIITFFLFVLSNKGYAQFQYISPSDGSELHNPQETIILRNGNIIDEGSLQSRHLFKITGSQSGEHDFAIKLTGEKKTILLKPLVPFSEGENVTVTVGEGLKSQMGIKISGTVFRFGIRAARTVEQSRFIAEKMQELYREESGSGINQKQGLNGDNAGLPNFTILTNTTPSPGEIFFHNFGIFNSTAYHYCIIENNGDSVYGKMDSSTFNNWDLNHNGYLTAYNKTDSVYEMFDSSYHHIASVQCGNGYSADVHEFQIYNDHQPYLFAYDPEIVDMTVYNPAYQPAATVVGLIVQQLDSSGNVIFQWRSWDHFNIIDCIHVNLYSAFIDAVHGNSLDLDHDGNIILSSRHLCEISKIDRATGNFIWRLGGLNNQYTFTNDADMISYQHDVRRLPNGNISVFDNGNYHAPPKTLAKEYHLDEVNHTATLVWSYGRMVGNTTVQSVAMGSLQLLADGHRFICWGLTYTPNAPQVTEVDSLGNVVWEMQITDGDNTVYRSRKYQWDPCSRPSLSSLKVKNITANSAKVVWDPATNAFKYDLRYRVNGTSLWTTKKNITDTKKKLKNLTASTKYDYAVRSFCDVYSPSGYTVTKVFTTHVQRLQALDSETGFSFDAFPNPANDFLQVRINLDEASPVMISLIDLSGRILMQVSQNAKEGEELISLDVKNIPAGIYLLSVSADGHGQVQKIAVN